jgi:UDP-2-acetamido-2,6-beta-L-arabino-hexul-4-ose reductase
MKFLITGANGFIAKNLIAVLNRDTDNELLLFNRHSSLDELETYIKTADFIVHLAGVNRPENISEFYEGNTDLTQTILELAQQHERKIPILLSSSTQVSRDNDYGKSKLAAEELVQAYSERNNVPVFIYRLPNVFGKWCRPNYNSVIATWCYNTTHDLPITINDRNTLLTLVYIDDVIASFMACLNSDTPTSGLVNVEPVYEKTLDEIETLLTEFKHSRESLLIPKVGFGFERALYATYLSYLPTDNFSYPLKGHSDVRGTFYEILKTQDSGQFSISTTQPGVTRGNHYHHTKNEKFLVIKGEALIELRHIVTNELVQYRVSGEQMQVVEMITGYTHNITNVGDTEMLLLIWANEIFNPEHPDTYFLKV